MGTTSSKLYVADAKLKQGDLLTTSKEYAKAIQHYQEALKLFRVVYKEQPCHPLIASTLYKLSLAQTGQDDANASFQESLCIRKRLRQEATHVDSLLVTLLDLYKQQLNPTAVVLTILAKYSSNLEVFYLKRSLDIYRQINRDKQNSLDVVVLLCGLTLVYLELNNYREAAFTFKECLDVSKRIPLDAESISVSLNISAKLYSKTNDWNDAIKHHKEGLDLRREIHSKNPRHADILASLDDLAEANEHRGNLDDAIKYTKEAFSLRKSAEDPFNLDFAECLIKLADLNRKSNQSDKESRLSRDLLDLCKIVLNEKYDISKLKNTVSEFSRSYITRKDDVIPYGEIAKLLDRLKSDTSLSIDYATTPTDEPPRQPSRPAGPK